MAISQEFPDENSCWANGDGYWEWWESNESVLIAVDSDRQTYLVRCSATGGPCQRVIDFGRLSEPSNPGYPEWTPELGIRPRPKTQ